MNAPFRVPNSDDCDPVQENAATSLFREIKASAAQLENAKAESLRLIAADVASGAMSEGEAEGLIKAHRLRAKLYSPPVDVPYTSDFERSMVEQIDSWDKYLIREHLRIGTITRSDAESLFIRLGFDAAAV